MKSNGKEETKHGQGISSGRRAQVSQDFKLSSKEQTKHRQVVVSGRGTVVGVDLRNASILSSPDENGQFNLTSKLYEGYRANGLLRGDGKPQTLSIDDYYKKLHHKLTSSPKGYSPRPGKTPNDNAFLEGLKEEPEGQK